MYRSRSGNTIQYTSSTRQISISPWEILYFVYTTTSTIWLSYFNDYPLLYQNPSMWDATRIVTDCHGCCVKPGVPATPELICNCTVPPPHLELIYRHTIKYCCRYPLYPPRDSECWPVIRFEFCAGRNPLFTRVSRFYITNRANHSSGRQLHWRFLL